MPPSRDMKLRAAPCERSPVTVRLRQHVGARRTATMADATSCPPRRCAARASLMRKPRKRADSYLRQCCDAAALLAAAVWSAPGARRRMCDAGCKVAAPARQDARRKAAAAHRLWAEQSRLKRAILEISILAGSFLSPSKWDAAKGLGRETWGAAGVCATSAQAAAREETYRRHSMALACRPRISAKIVEPAPSMPKFSPPAGWNSELRLSANRDAQRPRVEIKRVLVSRARC